MNSIQFYTPIPFTPILPILSYGSEIIEYSSNNSDIATINSNGLITMFKLGVVTFTALVNESNQYLATTTSSTLTIIHQNIQTGGDPIIITSKGEQFALAKHIKYINLLVDYENQIFINGYVDMLKITDFPRQIYWDGELSETIDLNHIYNNTYI